MTTDREDNDHRSGMSSRVALAGIGVLTAAVATACVPTTGGRTSTGASTTATVNQVLRVVVAEDDWGSIAAQVGGDHVRVTSIISNPNTDPHVYEPTAADARTVASADLVWYNAIGYDDWMPQLLAADGPKAALSVGRVLGVADGGNPHRWYNPTDTQRVISAYVSDLSVLQPAGAPYFRARAARYASRGLEAYTEEITTIRSRYGGTPVGASESIISMLAPAIDLDVLTPPSFLRAISEGSDVTAADKALIDRQIRHHLIKVYIYNSQNTTPDVQAQLAECQAAHIPTATITETLVPPTATYQAWQTRQLHGIAAALAVGTGR